MEGADDANLEFQEASLLVGSAQGFHSAIDFIELLAAGQICSAIQ